MNIISVKNIVNNMNVFLNHEHYDHYDHYEHYEQYRYYEHNCPDGHGWCRFSPCFYQSYKFFQNSPLEAPLSFRCYTLQYHFYHTYKGATYSLIHSLSRTSPLF